MQQEQRLQERSEVPQTQVPEEVAGGGCIPPADPSRDIGSDGRRTNGAFEPRNDAENAQAMRGWGSSPAAHGVGIFARGSLRTRKGSADRHGAGAGLNFTAKRRLRPRLTCAPLGVVAQRSSLFRHLS